MTPVEIECRKILFEQLLKHSGPTGHLTSGCIEAIIACVKREMIEDFIKPMMTLFDSQNKLNISDKELTQTMGEQLINLKHRIEMLEAKLNEGLQ